VSAGGAFLPEHEWFWPHPQKIKGGKCNGFAKAKDLLALQASGTRFADI
jgi:hypothetical protein